MTSSVKIDTAELFSLFSLEGNLRSYSLNLSSPLETVLPETEGRQTSLYPSEIFQPL